MAGVLEAIIYANGLQGCTYVEPFAGGAGAGISLLEAGHVDRVVINDADHAIYCFWWSVMNRCDQLVDRINSTPLSVAEWRKQRETYQSKKRGSQLDLGFATFYLNRCNRSGIIKNGGPIGGLHQTGDWRIDARFNRAGLAERVKEISAFGDRITILKVDAEHLVTHLNDYCPCETLFAYADPPYYLKGRELYLNHFKDDDHKAFAKAIQGVPELRWVMTYDNVPEIREMYTDSQQVPFTLRYSAHHASTEGGELLIAPPVVTIPQAAKDKLSKGGLFREIGRAENVAKRSRKQKANG